LPPGSIDVPGYGFPRKLRLTAPTHFKAVFNKTTAKVSNRYFLILARENQLDHARLGMIVGKKALPEAAQRNRLKRLLRTVFRLNQDLLVGLDIVILARSNISGLQNREITENIQRLLADLMTKSLATTQDPSSYHG
jgi:ribonuclease P protein component